MANNWEEILRLKKEEEEREEPSQVSEAFSVLQERLADAAARVPAETARAVEAVGDKASEAYTALGDEVTDIATSVPAETARVLKSVRDNPDQAMVGAADPMSSGIPQSVLDRIERSKDLPEKPTYMMQDAQGAPIDDLLKNELVPPSPEVEIPYRREEEIEKPSKIQLPKLKRKGVKEDVKVADDKTEAEIDAATVTATPKTEAEIDAATVTATPETEAGIDATTVTADDKTEAAIDADTITADDKTEAGIDTVTEIADKQPEEVIKKQEEAKQKEKQIQKKIEQVEKARDAGVIDPDRSEALLRGLAMVMKGIKRAAAGYAGGSLTQIQPDFGAEKDMIAEADRIRADKKDAQKLALETSKRRLSDLKLKMELNKMVKSGESTGKRADAFRRSLLNQMKMAGDKDVTMDDLQEMTVEDMQSLLKSGGSTSALISALAKRKRADTGERRQTFKEKFEFPFKVKEKMEDDIKKSNDKMREQKESPYRAGMEVKNALTFVEKELSDVRGAMDTGDADSIGQAMKALGARMAKLYGEKGVLTDQDVKRYVSTEKWYTKMKDWAKKGFVGLPSEEVYKSLSRAMNSARETSDQLLDRGYDEYATILSRQEGIDYNTARYALGDRNVKLTDKIRGALEESKTYEGKDAPQEKPQAKAVKLDAEDKGAVEFIKNEMKKPVGERHKKFGALYKKYKEYL